MKSKILDQKAINNRERMDRIIQNIQTLITDADKFTYDGGGVIAGFKSGKFSRTGGFAIFNPGPSIDNINTIEKAQDKEIAFFDAPVFKLFKSCVFGSCPW